MDSQFYSRENLLATKRLDGLRATPITDFVGVSDGNHMGVSDKFIDDADGIPYYRGADIYSLFIEQAVAPMRIDRATFLTPQMARSHLRKGDVLMSIVGAIIGNLSLVTQDVEAACSCKLAILRPKGIRAELLSVFLSSYFGQIQIQKFKRGAAQTGLILEDFDQLKIPTFSETFETTIAAIVKAAFDATEATAKLLSKSEERLLAAVGIEKGFLPSEIGNIKSIKDSFASTGRLDAEYYQPKYESLLALLRKDGLTVADVAPLRSERFQKAQGGVFQYVEIGGLCGDGTVLSQTVACADAPSRASQKVRMGDVITSTVRPIRRLSALVSSKQDGYVCSSGFVVLQPTRIAAEALLVYLRLPAICELMDLHTSASLYPAISEEDLLGLPIPEIPVAVQRKIAELVQQSFTFKAQSERLLAAAKRAVEIAIEKDEVAGLAYLEREGALT